MKKNAMTHGRRYVKTNVWADENSERKWKWALIGSFIFHLLCLAIVFWGAKQEEVPAATVTVVFSQILPASGSSATAATGKTTQTQTKAQTHQASSRPNNRQTAKSVTKNNRAERKLNLIRRTKSQPATVSVQSEVTTSQANLNPVPSVNKELTLTRNNRYVSPTQSSQKSSQTAEKVAISKPALASSSQLSGASVASVQNTPGHSAKSIKKFTRAGQGTGTSQNTAATGASSFDWNSGSKIRNLLSTQEPPLPAAIRNQGIRAQAIIKFRVDKNGRVFNVAIVKNSGYNELDDWTVKYVRTFRFNRVNDNFVYEAQYTQFFKP